MARQLSPGQRAATPIWLLLVELRTPLIVLILVYAVSVLGLVLIPGADDQGQVWHLSFLHAFYIVSYTGSTIGFGEIPYPFTDAQRLWMLVVLYASVIAWLYAIGSVLAVLSDPAFKQLRQHGRFVARISSLKVPFWIVCGYGGAGSELVRFLAAHGIRCVVVDGDKSRVDAARLSNLPYELDVAFGDAGEPQVLVDAGVTHPLCQGVLAMTDRDQINLTIATNARVLAPRVPVYSRSERDSTTRNLFSFDVEVVIDPYRIMAREMVQFIQRPWVFALYQQLVDPEIFTMPTAHSAVSGHWIVCASDRFAETLVEAFQRAEIRFRLVSPEPLKSGGVAGMVRGIGTEATTLREAEIMTAAGLIAATRDDGDNLSILLTARAENPALITVARRNRPTSEPVFARGQFNVVLRLGRIIAQELYARIRSPLLHQFLVQLDSMPEPLVEGIVQRLVAKVGSNPRDITHFSVTISPNTAPGVERWLARSPLTLAEMLLDPDGSPLPALCLLVIRLQGDVVPFPGDGFQVQSGDRCLIWGESNVESRLEWILGRDDVLAEAIVRSTASRLSRPSNNMLQSNE